MAVDEPHCPRGLDERFASAFVAPQRAGAAQRNVAMSAAV